MSKYDTFCTHNWGKDNSNHDRVVAIARELLALGVKVWIDEEQMEGRVTATMCNGIDNSAMMTVFITKEYVDKVAGVGRNGLMDNCLKEFEYAEIHKGSALMIPVVMEEAMEDNSMWTGPVGANLAGKMRIRGWVRPAGDVARDIADAIAKLVPEFRARRMIGVSHNQNTTIELEVFRRRDEHQNESMTDEEEKDMNITVSNNTASPSKCWCTRRRGLCVAIPLLSVVVVLVVVVLFT